jgi:hypothetical protein
MGADNFYSAYTKLCEGWWSVDVKFQEFLTPTLDGNHFSPRNTLPMAVRSYMVITTLNNFRLQIHQKTVPTLPRSSVSE